MVSMPEGLRDRLAVTGKTYYRYIRLSDEGLPVMEDRGTQEVAGQPMNVELSSLEEYRAQIATERISLDSGAVATFERSRTIEHSVELTSTGSLEGSLGVNLINQVRGEVRGKIEKTIGRSFKESETFRNSVTLDGTVSPHWKLIWFEVGRSGAAEVKSADGNTETVRFRFAEGVELEVKAILPAR